MRMRVGPKNSGQDDGIARIRLSSTSAVPIAIPRNGQWIDGVYPPTGSEQRGNEEQDRTLDGDCHWLINAFATFSEHSEKIGETCCADADPPYRQDAARFINDSDIVVVFGPSDPTRQTHVDPPSESTTDSVEWAPAA